MKKWVAKIRRWLSPLEKPSTSCFINYKTAMNQTDWRLSGMCKLSASEKHYLTQWTARYYAQLQQIKWCKSLEIAHQAGKWDLAMVAIFHNEAPYLKEWIEYHILLGVQHYVLYNNFSTDRYLEVLEPYLAKGIVELIEWPIKGHPAPGQLEAYLDAIRRLRGKAHWVAFIDVDEFFVPKQWDNLLTFLAEYEDYAEVVVNWQLFGTSNVQMLPTEALLTEHLTSKFPANFHHAWNTNHYVKAIVKPECVKDHVNLTTHFFDLKPGCVAVDPNKNVINTALNPNIPTDRIQLNHYWFRTIDAFYRKRRVHEDNLYTPELVHSLFTLGNSEQDTSIQRFLPALKAHLKNAKTP